VSIAEGDQVTGPGGLGGKEGEGGGIKSSSDRELLRLLKDAEGSFGARSRSVINEAAREMESLEGDLVFG
jgi:hypothetical protein